ncbi:MAG: YbeD family protein [Pseudomonadota bacterium]
MNDRRPTDIRNEALWEFPMHYPLKIMGEAQHPLREIVVNILRRHVPDFDPSTLTERASSAGKYLSLSVTLYVERKEQINGLYADLAACAQIRLVL